jgi:ribulose 1,5-bisphosphate synthetase/thiazole synthase
MKLKHIDGKLEEINTSVSQKTCLQENASVEERPVIVGAGPAGLFAAVSLIEAGIKPIIIERGQPVDIRGRDIGSLFNRKVARIVCFESFNK